MTDVASVSFLVYALLPFHVFAFLRGKSSTGNARAGASHYHTDWSAMSLGKASNADDFVE